MRESFGKQGLMRHLGATMTDVRSGEVRIRMPFKPELTQQHGFFHAGGTSAIADTAGGYAGLTVFPRGSAVLTVEFKINLLAPAKGEALGRGGPGTEIGAHPDGLPAGGLRRTGWQDLVHGSGRPADADLPQRAGHAESAPEETSSGAEDPALMPAGPAGGQAAAACDKVDLAPVYASRSFR